MDATAFNKRLDEVFGGRLRLRWSGPKGEWHLEQKMGRGVFDPPTRQHDAESDRRQRARDGYDFVMAIRPGDRMPCPTCGQTLRVPIMETAEVSCGLCIGKNRDMRLFAAYFPLGETLIDYLRRIDPLSDGVRRQAADIDKARHQLEASKERAADGALHDGLVDAAIDQIPAWGYGGMKRFEA